MSETVLLTGVTGFLGMEVLARLLEDRPDVEILSIVRAQSADAASARLEQTLLTLYDVPPPGARERLRALPGDLTLPALGLSDTDRALVRSRATIILHCAASISFTLPLEEARAINVEGTRRVLELARELGGLRRLVHVSTAYVAGRHAGVFREDDLHLGRDHRNTYERSKHEAELLVAAADGDLPLTVARPSIVVGDSRTGWTPAFNVIYWPLRAFDRGLLDRVPALTGGLTDIVPVDYVADALVHLAGREETSGPVHLVAGDRAVDNAELIELACRHLDRPRPESVSTADTPALEHADVYRPYLDVRCRFDDRRARSLLTEARIDAPPLQDYFGTLIDYARRTRWGKRPISRQAANTPLDHAVA